MKVLLLSPDGHDLLDPAAPAARRLVRYGALVERFDVLLPGPQGKTTRLSERVTLYGLSTVKKGRYLLRLPLAVCRRVRAERYDVLSTRDTYFLGALAVILARLFGIGLEIQVHGFEKLHGLRRWMARFALPRADSVRAVSGRLRQKLVTDFGVRPERITVCPIYVDYATFLKLDRPARPHAPFTFLTVGRLVPIKNIAMQLHALAEVRQTTDARLIVVGDGPLREDLQRLVKGLGLQGAVEFAGATKDVVPFFARADVFMITSHEEGYGLAPIEAACAGLPILMTDVGCAGEVIRDGEQGIVLPVNDRAALVGAMRRVMGDEGLRATITAQRGRIRERIPSLDATLVAYRASWERAAHSSRNGRALRTGLQESR